MFKPVSPKADFVKIERKRLSAWYKNGIIKKYLEKNRDSRNKFSFIDGPITANNPMGVHHAWGRTYKDLWQRFFNMRGCAQRFQNGFDEQGLWVEVEVERELGLKTKKDIENLVPGKIFESIAKFVNLCKERVKKYSAVQTDQSRRLGYFMDWDNSYHTSSDENNYAIWHYLKMIHEKGWLYKGRDSVPWCPRCGTAISQHEILTEEYQELTHKAVFVKYPIVGRKKEFLLVWTTTPWTLPGNVSAAVNPDFVYRGLGVKDEVLWFAEDRWEHLKNLLLYADKPGEVEVAKKIEKKGKELVGWEYVGPFDNLERVKEAKKQGNFHRVVSSEELVTAEEGTGLVHIAPGAGEEDFKLSQEENLPVVELIDEEAVYLGRLGEFSGKNAKTHPEVIIDYLRKKSYLFAEENYTHRYPICWRCKRELVWRVVDEWYIAMDRKDPRKGKTYREMMKEVIKEIKWIPKWGYDRELDWLNNMHDWLISKKRYWGLALPIWECKKCGNFEVIGSKKELKEKAVDGWNEFNGNSPHRPWVDQVKINCSECGETISRISDVGNPWLDAGIVSFSTLKYFEDKNYWRQWFPADFITESFPGQFKNWFYSLIAMSTALENTAPFKVLLGHGQVRDEKGEEMHKSKGNAIEFNDAAEKIGVDVMRWLYLRTNPEHNVNFGFHVADEVRRGFHLRLWNVYAFFVNYAQIDGWEPKSGEFTPKNILDKWILSRLVGSIENIRKSLERYDAADAVENAEIFVVNDLSNWYIRRIRDRVGPTVKNGEDKTEAYQTLWIVLTTYLKVLAPMIPYMADEIYTNLTQEDSVHLSEWPSLDYVKDDALEKQMTRAMKVSGELHAARKADGRKVRQPLGSAVYSGEKLPSGIESLIRDEVNIKDITNNPKSKVSGSVLDTTITQELKEEGEARDLIRKIQDKRKEAGVAFDSQITVYAPTWPKKFEGLIKQETLAKNLIKGETIRVEVAETGGK
jgi:isoleucyl-tRNA synthetase